MGGESYLGRGQTEPLAALIAVSVVAGAFSLYVGFLTGYVSDLGNEREFADATAQLVWDSVSVDGVYEDGTDIGNRIPSRALPQGKFVYINVTYVDRTGDVSEKAAAQFGVDGTPRQSIDPPTAGDVFERPIAVQHSAGHVRPGKLTVVVWDAA